MASKRYSVYIADGGQPAAGLTPTWSSLRRASDGTDLSASPPAIAELGGGLYGFDFDADASGAAVGVVDAGAAVSSAGERYVPVACESDGVAARGTADAAGAKGATSLALTVTRGALVDGQVLVFAGGAAAQVQTAGATATFERPGLTAAVASDERWTALPATALAPLADLATAVVEEDLSTHADAPAGSLAKRVDAAMSSRQPAGNVTVGGYATGASPAEQVLTTPANTISSDANGAVPAASLAAQAQTDVQSALTAQGLTGARAGLLDNLNVGGLVAAQQEVLSIQNNTSAVRSVPSFLERPTSGSRAYVVELLLYNDAGGMQVPDAAPTLAVANESDVSRDDHLDVTAMALVSPGRYRATYTVQSADPKEELRFVFTVIEAGVTRSYTNAATVVDTIAVDFTAADRTLLQEIHTNADVATSTRATHADLPAAPNNAGIAAIQAKTDALPAVPASQDDVTAARDAIQTAVAAVPDGAEVQAAAAAAIAAYEPAKAGDAMALTPAERQAAADAYLGRSAKGGADGGFTVSDSLTGKAIKAVLTRAGTTGTLTLYDPDNAAVVAQVVDLTFNGKGQLLTMAPR